MAEAAGPELDGADSVGGHRLRVDHRVDVRLDDAELKAAPQFASIVRRIVCVLPDPGADITLTRERCACCASRLRSVAGDAFVVRVDVLL